MVIKVYIASSTGSVAVKKHQQAVVGFLEANRISFQEVDITMLEEQRLQMYRNIPKDKQPEKGNPLPPQIFNEDRYCGDYEDFFQSKEDNTVFAFLGLSSQPSVKCHTYRVRIIWILCSDCDWIRKVDSKTDSRVGNIR
ncbi:SH3 domain-binding glutamic acid-rich-like protein 2 isoform X3 [Anoplopoma fimbria]|uniref:SH3 domain-binding glutamic acid-rich-like protein 2 isoform X3 n=1 Tax=Anoplopoma fimbria TaxID=229290 RepID=UPI0023EBF5B3|nr:SH3 domain-binding glutamic acid-rich-like protein 2 isoform X3 [Anoplopoma fimbria]